MAWFTRPVEAHEDAHPLEGFTVAPGEVGKGHDHGEEPEEGHHEPTGREGGLRIDAGEPEPALLGGLEDHHGSARREARREEDEHHREESGDRREQIRAQPLHRRREEAPQSLAPGPCVGELPQHEGEPRVGQSEPEAGERHPAECPRDPEKPRPGRAPQRDRRSLVPPPRHQVVEPGREPSGDVVPRPPEQRSQKQREGRGNECAQAAAKQQRGRPGLHDLGHRPTQVVGRRDADARQGLPRERVDVGGKDGHGVAPSDGQHADAADEAHVHGTLKALVGQIVEASDGRRRAFPGRAAENARAEEDDRAVPVAEHRVGARGCDIRQLRQGNRGRLRRRGWRRGGRVRLGGASGLFGAALGGGERREGGGKPDDERPVLHAPRPAPFMGARLILPERRRRVVGGRGGAHLVRTHFRISGNVGRFPYMRMPIR
jgi:hypothetical protein